MAAVALTPQTFSYPVTVSCALQGEYLHAEIDTERLQIRSIIDSDLDKYVQLYGDKEVMATFTTSGNPLLTKEIEKRVIVWLRKWQSEHNPYSALTVIEKSSQAFLGSVSFSEESNRPGRIQLRFLFMKNHWKKGYGKEAVVAVMKHFIPATLQRGYTCQGETVRTIWATVDQANLASQKIVEAVGMQHKEQLGEELNEVMELSQGNRTSLIVRLYYSLDPRPKPPPSRKWCCTIL
jgi:[ribosomal protein S5]-alanine N-acetyltransferase